MKSIWIVTKDMRLEDNNVLKRALNESDDIYPVFVIDYNQIRSGGVNSLHFMIESLDCLNENLKKINSCVHLLTNDSLKTFISDNSINRAYILKGFTPFEKDRNFNYSQLINLIEIDDCLGKPRDFFLKSDGTTYHVFSPYCKSVITKGGLDLPDNNIPSNINKCKGIDSFMSFSYLSFKNDLPPKPLEAEWKGGFEEGKSICYDRWYNLQIFLTQSNVQKKKRKDISPHVKFGTVSPRLVYHCGLVDENPSDIFKEHVEGKGILWRALYYNLMDKGEIILKQRNVQWINQTLPEQTWKHIFNLWCTGTTGFDFVDAGIHQLLKSGIIDNEVRMLVANFLVFALGIDWRLGEEFFRIHLVDYDWPLNVGNWAWSAQVGMDNPSPNRAYQSKSIRIFNPETYKTKTKREKEYRENYISKWLQRTPNSISKCCDFKSQISYNLQFY